MALDSIQRDLLAKVADIHETPLGAYNIRSNGASAGRATTANINIVTKEDKPGIDIIIAPGTKNESVCSPVRAVIQCSKGWYHGYYRKTAQEPEQGNRHMISELISESV